MFEDAREGGDCCGLTAYIPELSSVDLLACLGNFHTEPLQSKDLLQIPSLGQTEVDHYRC